MSVIIVGGGIAGLSLALSLHQAGIGARVFEQVSAIRPLGFREAAPWRTGASLNASMVICYES